MNGALRLALFIDAQNTYKGAREAFFPDGGHYTDGQIDPRKVAERLQVEVRLMDRIVRSVQ